MVPQPPRVGITDVIDPALDTGVEFREGDAALAPGVEAIRKPPRGVDCFAGLQAAVRGVDDEAEPGDAGGDWLDLSGLGVNGEAEGLKAFDDGLLPGPQLLLAIGEQGHVIDIAQVGGAVWLQSAWWPPSGRRWSASRAPSARLRDRDAPGLPTGRATRKLAGAAVLPGEAPIAQETARLRVNAQNRYGCQRQPRNRWRIWAFSP